MEKEDEPRWKTPEVNDGRILVARRNLRIHQRNHSWGSEQYLQKASSNKGFDFSQLDLDQLDDETEGDQPRDAKTSIGGSSEEEEERPPSRRWEPSSSLHCICMVSDFFYPDAGGVENHMYMLSQCLLQLGHKVIVVTRARGNRQGVRWLTNGLKVYYLPLMPMPDVFSSGRVTLPTLFSSWPIFRFICIRERVTIVHGHQAFSIICHESLMHAGTMGLKVIFTDHSLFGFSDPSAIHMNKVLNFTLSCINHVICVSHTSKENTVLRASIEPSHVSVIPNAVDTSVFTPNPTARKSNCITIVCITRLVYRKGVDLMVEIIPSICQQFEHVNFVIGGDGPMRVALEQMRENHQLQDRVEMLGHVRHTDVRNVLVRGHIYLNCSLTEAFCIAILEAASCGLLVVSTRVGGVPEVMPSHMIKYASPDANSLIEVMQQIIDVKEVVPSEFHANIKKMYSWHDVAKRTCKVYDRVVQDKPKPLLERLKRCHSRGPFFGILIAFLVAVDFIVWQIICWIYPEEDIEIAVDYPYHHNVSSLFLVSSA
ncbi:hypothetical protein GUITHDRAFT_68256 [Guillardia theta CCMP2712]|uniref:phosphatidylinositol N-acetylglucosaminyltransferase n=1 Tax=Guillardia theta (strain CCMP2712) TaxID=905079 RepID=L1JL33_GUITC|nr:hypothetical protein GUITHDRAFT_68256 [Guillardia theta CCMP2712]EKX49218.1 hypothetical protein GUITHDRAFT_68256 [Guillardia theta CCMP2712]|eukprot:XP_005836198.1 hypothetical protein GUITHDRAFT_68256 [Guillardia theta CCMP2712]